MSLRLKASVYPIIALTSVPSHIRHAMNPDRYQHALRTLLKGSGCLVYLDGRNEHGTHILPGLLGHVDWTEVEALEVAENPAFTEEVFSEAEAAGFKAGDWVWLTWRRDPGQYGNEGCEIAPYWEYVGVDVEISETVRETLS